MSDYENYDNLAFEPKITWAELCEYVEEKYPSAVKLKMPEIINLNSVNFYKTGEVVHDFSFVAENRTYEQMKTIIDALWG